MRINRKILIASVLAVILVGAGFLLSGKSEIVDTPKEGSNIIAFGDSLVTGYGVSTVGDDFVSLLSKRTNREIINAGLNGDTTASALVRLDKDVLSQDPRIVIVLLGGNDALRQVPPEETFKNLGSIIDQIHEKGAAVILVGVRGGVLSDKYKDSFRDLAREKRVNFVPNILDDVFSVPALMFDPVHPNGAGHALMADRIEPVLRKLID